MRVNRAERVRNRLSGVHDRIMGLLIERHHDSATLHQVTTHEFVLRGPSWMHRCCGRHLITAVIYEVTYLKQLADLGFPNPRRRIVSAVERICPQCGRVEDSDLGYLFWVLRSYL